MEVKVCKDCKRELPLTIEYFEKAVANKDGFRGQCRECISKRKKIYRQNNIGQVLEHNANWRKNNKEKKAKIDKEYCIKNKENILEYHKRYREENRDEIIRKQKEYRKLYPELIKESNRKYREKYPEFNKQYKEENKEKIKQYDKEHLEDRRIKCQRYRTKKRLLPSTLTKKQWEQIKQYFNNRCCYCGQELPLTQDHWVALSKGGEYTHNNIVPSCGSCNSSKRDTDFFEWYSKQKFYSKKREKLILKFLGYEKGIQQLKII